MRRRRALTAEEEALWRRVVATVKPMPGKVRLVKSPASGNTEPTAEASNRPAEVPASAPTLRTALPNDFRIGAHATKAASPNARPALVQKGKAADVPDKAGERRVRRGRLDIHSSLDLHGFNQDQARHQVSRFLTQAAWEGARVVIIVTGRGGRLSQGDAAPGVLRRRLPEWLSERRDLVAGFAQAHRRHGGEGAFYVFLKQSRDADA